MPALSCWNLLGVIGKHQMFLKASKERGPCPQTSTPDKTPLGLILGVVKSRALTTDLGLHPVFPAQSSGAWASWSECFSSLTGVTVSTLGRAGVQTLACDVIRCTPRNHQEGSLPHFLQTMLQWELTERLSLINLYRQGLYSFNTGRPGSFQPPTLNHFLQSSLLLIYFLIGV